MNPRLSYLLFAWRTVSTPSRLPEDREIRYYYSLRPINKPTNSIITCSFDSRSGRNGGINFQLSKYPKGSIRVLRNTDPKIWLVELAKLKRKNARNKKGTTVQLTIDKIKLKQIIRSGRK